MIKSIEQVAGGHRVAWRMNEQAQKPHCWSPIFTTMEELLENHPDLTEVSTGVEIEEVPAVAPVAAPAAPPPKPKRVRKGRKRK